MAPTSTDSVGMREAAKQFAETLTTIDHRLRTLDTQLSGIVWTGSSRMTFDTTMDAWNSKFKVVYQRLADMAEMLHVGANEYEHVEQDAVAAGKFFQP